MTMPATTTTTTTRPHHHNDDDDDDDADHYHHDKEVGWQAVVYVGDTGGPGAGGTGTDGIGTAPLHKTKQGSRCLPAPSCAV
jgi:hypothetical protein